MKLLYHATYRPYLERIQRFGLGGSPEQIPRNYEDSEPGVVYLASSVEVALSYAETSDLVPEKWLDDIVVLSVDTEHLDTALLQPDKNVRLACEELPATFEYRGVVPPAALQPQR